MPGVERSVFVRFAHRWRDIAERLTLAPNVVCVGGSGLSSDAMVQGDWARLPNWPKTQRLK